MPVRTLKSRSSKVKLFNMKNLSLCPAASATGGALVVGLVTAAASDSEEVDLTSVESVVAVSFTSTAADGCEVVAAGPVGAVTPDAPSTVFFLRRLTSLTV